MADPLVLDLNDIAQGKVELGSFRAKLESLDLAPYHGREVQVQGCAPTWAHLLVAGKLYGKVKKLEFLMDDGKGGIPVEVYKS
jgi:hypothetical protein